MKLFTADTLGSLLTVEDVPPRHSGGRPLVLTCRACNSAAGHGIDAMADRVERSIRALAGDVPIHGRLHVGNDEVPARIELRSAGQSRVTMLGGAPTALGRIAEYLDGLTRASDQNDPFRLSFQLTDPNERRAKVSWLKSAYLAVFSLLGYRYAMHPFLGPVRRQIQEPDREHLSTFSTRLAVPMPFSECRIFRVANPDIPSCWGVLMGSILVLLPHGDPNVLYPRLTELKAQRASFDFRAENCIWPTAPLFALADTVFPRSRAAVAQN